jgi:hypothetical protein
MEPINVSDYYFLQTLYNLPDLKYEVQKYRAIDNAFTFSHKTEELAIVVTPTIGTEHLRHAISSVLNQSYKKLVHLIVCDGQRHLKNVSDIVSEFSDHRLSLMVLPYNTGASGFNGHRIYSAISFLLNSEFTLLLDEDNWYGQRHVESLISCIKTQKLDWAYSMRTIHDEQGTLLVDDDCESIGPFRPISGFKCLVDTNCYCFRTEVLAKVGHHWYHTSGADRYVFGKLSQLFPKYSTTKLHTLRYRLKSHKGLSKDFFIEGNRVMRERYNGYLPWKQQDY